MNDTLTPKERVEKALEAAGFAPMSYGLPDEYWRLHSVGYPDRVVIRPNTHNQYSEYVCDIHITDAPEHLPAYLHAKAMVEACEALLKALPTAEIELAREVWGNTNTRTALQRIEDARNAVAKAKGA